MNDLFNKIVRIVQGIYALTLKQLGHKKVHRTFCRDLRHAEHQQFDFGSALFPGN
jgi:hypothetical protein